MSRALADPCLFITVLFSASAHWDSIQGVPHSPQTLYHQSLALKLLREQLKDSNRTSYEMAGSALALTFYNMSGCNTDSALIHRNGLLQMLAENRNQGPEFEALTALVNLILLGLSVVVHEEPPFIPSVDISTHINHFTLKSECLPSNLLRRAIIRVAENQNSLITSDTASDLHSVLDFIITAEHASIQELYTLHAASIMDRDREEGFPETTTPTNKTGQIINECCHLAIRIFWSILQEALCPNSTSVASGRTTISHTAIKMLRPILCKLDMVSWKKHAPEAYLWICFTAAAACDKPASRVPYVTVATPVLSASDTTELSLARECWWYYKWLCGFLCLRAGKGNAHEGVVSTIS
ncbi:hypothetical protein BDW68DRAFT_164482 [Aspergillus falconensis]